MQDHTLVGKRVMNRTTKSIGTIKSVKDGKVFVFDGFDTFAYPYPAAFADTLILEDEGIQEELKSESYDAKFGSFKAIYANAIRREISYLKETGGKKYKIVDGDRIPNSNSEESYIYSFDTDSDLHFPDGTVIRLWLENDKPFANVIACEECTIVFRTAKYLGEKVDHIEFTAEPWQLMESLIERLDELDEISAPLAYELVCKGKSQVNRRWMIEFGQDLACKKVSEQPITFVWGPPGTGKTTTLARVALDFMNKGKRILMLSYSNVSVDGATLGVANRIDNYEGRVVRYLQLDCTKLRDEFEIRREKLAEYYKNDPVTVINNGLLLINETKKYYEHYNELDEISKRIIGASKEIIKQSERRGGASGSKCLVAAAYVLYRTGDLAAMGRNDFEKAMYLYNNALEFLKICNDQGDNSWILMKEIGFLYHRMAVCMERKGNRPGYVRKCRTNAKSWLQSAYRDCDDPIISKTLLDAVRSLKTKV